jgi:hypothetical protein
LGTLNALQVLALGDVGVRTVEARLFVVEQDEADRALAAEPRLVKDARQFHDDGGPGAVVVRGLPPADAIHVGADDVHLVRELRADLRAVDLIAWRGPWRSRLRVESAQGLVGLQQRIVVHAGARAMAEQGTATLAARSAQATAAHRGRRPSRRCGARPGSGSRSGLGELVGHALGVRAAVAPELSLDPIECFAIAFGALSPIAEPGELLDRGLVAIEIELTDELGHGIVGGNGRWRLWGLGREQSRAEQSGDRHGHGAAGREFVEKAHRDSFLCQLAPAGEV